MLFNALSGHPDLWSLYRESGGIIEGFLPVKMTPGASDVVESDDVNEQTITAIAQVFAESVGNAGSGHFSLSRGASAFLRTRLGQEVMQLPGISKLRLASIYSRRGQKKKVDEFRIVEKTPVNCFKIQLLERVFPDAIYIYITRDPRQTIASIYTGWTESREFRRFPFPEGFELAGYEPRWWSFGLIPGWESLNGAPLMEVCARQWLLYNRFCQRDLPSDKNRTVVVAYEDLVAHPGEVLRRIAHWAGLEPSPFEQFERTLPVVNTFTDPHGEKWRNLEAEIREIEPVVRGEAAALGYRL